jgi:hypothetical protein
MTSRSALLGPAKLSASTHPDESRPAMPWLATVEVTAQVFGDAGKTPAAIRADVFKAEDRVNSRGELIAGNGLGRYGAIVRRGRKVLIDVHRYGNWLSGRDPVNG